MKHMELTLVDLAKREYAARTTASMHRMNGDYLSERQALLVADSYAKETERRERLGAPKWWQVWRWKEALVAWRLK